MISPAFVAPTVGFDIGGTNVRAAVVDKHGHILAEEHAPTPQSQEALEDVIAEVMGTLAEHSPAACGLAIAGFLDPECENVRFAPHLPWRDAPVKARLQERLGLPVTLEHDANSAAWGEYRFGGAQGQDNWVFFAVGTGIGATLMIGGEVYRGAFGTAPEFGHLTVVPGGRACECGKRGCLERYASGTALLDTAREILSAQPHLRDAPLGTALSAGRPISGKEIMQAAAAGDALGLAVIENFGTWLGEGLAFVADVLDPGLILIGGGVSANADLFLDTAVDTMASRIVGAGHRPLPRVAPATLGPEAGMIGVADLARRALI